MNLNDLKSIIPNPQNMIILRSLWYLSMRLVLLTTLLSTSLWLVGIDTSHPTLYYVMNSLNMFSLFLFMLVSIPYVINLETINKISVMMNLASIAKSHKSTDKLVDDILKTTASTDDDTK